MRECEFFSAFCFEIGQYKTDTKMKKISVNALSTNKFLSNIRSRTFQILFLKTSNTFT